MNVIFLNESEIIASFPLRKKIVSQNRLNPLLVEQIQDNKSIIKSLKKQTIKFDKSIQNQNDIINNINKKIDIFNNSINNIISDINNINKAIKYTIQNEIKNNTNLNNNENNEKYKKSSNSVYKNLNNSKILKNEDKKHLNSNEKIDNKEKENKNKKVYENKEEYLCKNKKIYHIDHILIILNIFIIIVIVILYNDFYQLNKGFNLEKIKEEKLKKIILAYDFIYNLTDEELEYIEAYMKKTKEDEKEYLKKNNSNYIIPNIKNKIKAINNTNSINNNINYQNNNYNKVNKDVKNKNIKTNNNKTQNHNKINNHDNNNSFNNNKAKNFSIQNNIKKSNNNSNNIKEIKNNHKKEEILLDDSEELKYFKDKIKQKTQYKIKDVNLVLKYNSAISEYNDFYSNCRGISQNLILLKNKEGIKIGIFSKNIIDIWNNIKDNNYSVDDNNFFGYIFSYKNSNEKIYQDFFKNYNAFTSIFKDIFIFLDKKKHFKKNKELNDIYYDINSKEETNYFGEIVQIEIYQIKYVIK